VELFSANNLPNVLLFIAGLGGIGVGIYTLRDIRKQTTLLGQYVNTTKQMAVATLRPKLSIPAIALIPGKLEDVDGIPTLKDDHDWKIECLVANTGASKADVIESNLTLSRWGIADSVLEILPVFPPHNKSRDSFGTITIESGERHRICVLLDQNDTMLLRVSRQRQQRGGHTSTTQIVCFGFLRYLDTAGVARCTGFAFKYSIQRMSFTRLEHLNYDYAD
jgi:hypothetical protein